MDDRETPGEGFEPDAAGCWSDKPLETIKRQVEASTYHVRVDFNGVAQGVLVARLFLDRDGKMLAVRSLRLTALDGSPFPHVNSGKYENVAALLEDAKEKANG